MMVEEQKLDAVISLPSGAFKPYAGVSTAILLFTKTNSGGTDHVWFYDMKADGWSLDDKRQPLLSDDKLGLQPLRTGATSYQKQSMRRTTCPMCWSVGAAGCG
jgi:type I restriction enzyme M protein